MKGTKIADKIQNLINERAKLQTWKGLDQEDFNMAQSNIANLLSEDEEETIAYINGWCTGIDLEFVIEVADQINSKLHSERFMNALREAAKRNYETQLESINMAEDDSAN